MKQWLAVILALTLLCIPPALAESASDWFDKGVDAYEAGDYETAAEYLRLAADQGQADAQSNLGVLLYERPGRGAVL